MTGVLKLAVMACAHTRSFQSLLIRRRASEAMTIRQTASRRDLARSRRRRLPVLSALNLLVCRHAHRYSSVLMDRGSWQIQLRVHLDLSLVLLHLSRLNAQEVSPVAHLVLTQIAIGRMANT